MTFAHFFLSKKRMRTRQTKPSLTHHQYMFDLQCDRGRDGHRALRSSPHSLSFGFPNTSTQMFPPKDKWGLGSPGCGNGVLVLLSVADRWEKHHREGTSRFLHALLLLCNKDTFKFPFLFVSESSTSLPALRPNGNSIQVHACSSYRQKIPKAEL